jgi:hypothetical protein
MMAEQTMAGCRESHATPSDAFPLTHRRNLAGLAGPRVRVYERC